MKKMRRLIPAIAMLLVSAVMLSTASFAWFTMGSSATANGMQVQAQASSALLIVNKYDATNELQKFQSATNIVDLKAQNKTTLLPATLDATKTSTLATITDPTKVNPTGKYDADTHGMTEVLVADKNDSRYYTDYTVYLFVSGAAAEAGKDLKVTVTPDKFNDIVHNAVSINFLVDASTKDEKELTYITMINFETASKGGTDAEVNLGQIDIPVGLNSDQTAVADYVTVVMRVYYDGNLPDATDTTKTKNYVRNDRVSTNNVGFKVDFDLVEHVADEESGDENVDDPTVDPGT